MCALLFTSFSMHCLISGSSENIGPCYCQHAPIQNPVPRATFENVKNQDVLKLMKWFTVNLKCLIPKRPAVTPFRPVMCLDFKHRNIHRINT